MRRPRIAHHRGPCPLALRAHPQDIWGQKMDSPPSHFLSENIPAGGFDLNHAHGAAEPGAQNSFCKNFDPQGGRP